VIYKYFVPVNQYVLMMPPCKAWQVLYNVVWGVKRGDYIEVIELDNLSIETGRRLIGLVRFVGSGDMVINNNSSTLAYTIQIEILPPMKKIVFTFNLDDSGRLGEVLLVYNTTGVSWDMEQPSDGNFTLTPSSDFPFTFKTYSVSTPNDINKSVAFDNTSTTCLTTFSTYAITGSITSINMLGGWVEVVFYG